MSSGISAEDCAPLSSSNSFSFSTHVSYSCGSCRYELNLNSCNRNISAIDAKYGKSMKRGVISFFSIDESRFTQINKVRWLPYLGSKNSWRLFQRRTNCSVGNVGTTLVLRGFWIMLRRTVHSKWPSRGRQLGMGYLHVQHMTSKYVL